MAKEPTYLAWIEDQLPEGVHRKPMFGGFAYYLDDRLILTTFESPGDRTYKNKSFNFDIWNGCLFPTEREHHKAILQRFPYLVNHPVLSKWLYLPAQTEDFETQVDGVLRELRRHSPLFGIIPKPKKPRRVQTKVKRREDSEEDLDTRYPMMFRDEPVEVRIAKAKKISDLKNLGPVSEKIFQKAGIRSVQMFVKLGWKKTMEKLVKSNPKHAHAVFAYAIIGALDNTDWNRITPKQKAEAQAFAKSLRQKKKKK